MARITKPTPIDERTDEQAAANEPTHAEIEVRAYYRYLERGLQDGFDLDDWLAAEAELRANGEVLTTAA